MNFSYADVVRAADNVQLYKLVCRTVALNLGLTATFLPKPFTGINGSGIEGVRSLLRALGPDSIGSSVELLVARAGGPSKISVSIGERPNG